MLSRKYILGILLATSVAVYLASCGRPPEPKEEPPEPSEPVATVFEPQPEPSPVPEPPQRRMPQRPAGVYELVWVEPRIIAADTAMMLIAADRIDSVEVRPNERSTYQTPSISFRVTSSNCPAKINLVDGRGALKMHLFNRELSPGYYKLTLSTSNRSSQLAAGDYYLKAEYCGKTKRVAVKLD